METRNKVKGEMTKTEIIKKKHLFLPIYLCVNLYADQSQIKFAKFAKIYKQQLKISRRDT